MVGGKGREGRVRCGAKRPGGGGGGGEKGGAGGSTVDDDAKRKRAPTGGKNQREVQKRYRERKKEYTKDLEKQVAALHARLREVESAEASRKHEGVAVIAAGLANGLAMGMSSSFTLSAQDKNASEEDMAVRQYGAGIEKLKDLLDRGASDTELRSVISKMCVQVCTRLLTPESNFGRAMMHRHAKILNEERMGADGGAGAGEMVVCGSVCGGFLKANPSANPDDRAVWSLGDDEARVHWKKVVDHFEDVVPPNEVNKLLEWRNEYVAGLSDIYSRRQELGLQLAFTGPNQPQTAAAAPVRTDGGERLAFVTAADNNKDGDAAGNHLIQPRGEGVTSGHAVPPVPSIDDATLSSFSAHTSLYIDTMSIIEALKASVAAELKFKHDNTSDLINGRVTARTCAHIALLSYPLMPDPLAVASEVAARRKNDANSGRAKGGRQ